MPTLAEIYSALESAKRKATGFGGNPGTSLHQMVGYANDRANESDQIQATPRNQSLGMLADVLAKSYSPERTQQMQGLMELLSVPQISQTINRLSYGEPLTTGTGGLGGTTRIRPEVMEAGMAVAPFIGSAGKVAESGAMMAGRAGERYAEKVVPQIMERGGLGAEMLQGLAQGSRSQVFENKNMLSYRGIHTAPTRDFGAPLHDLSQMYPDDIYSAKAAQYYGHSLPYDQKAASIMQMYRNKPNATVTIYRAVPSEKTNADKAAELDRHMAAYMRRGLLPQDAHIKEGSKWYDWAYNERNRLRNLPDEPIEGINAINPGDWVTLTKDYAKEHGESALRGNYKIISKKVKAKDVYTNADSIHEFGYDPSK